VDNILWLLAVGGSFYLGFKGFSLRGIPVTKHRRIEGRTAKKLGYVLIGLGVLLLGLWIYWFSWMAWFGFHT
jgi:hypothetical protein